MYSKDEMLAERAAGFAIDYFDDMRFISFRGCPSIIHPFLTVLSNGQECVDHSPQLDILDFNFIIDEIPEGFGGQCNTTNKTVTIAPEYENDDTLLLHEMIHAFEHLINICTDYSQFHDVVLLLLV